MPLSFWEQDALLDADFIVVGAGLIGLQTALELRDRAPMASIAVLERGVIPHGASSRNAGFACFGSLTEILHDVGVMGEDAALAMVEQRWRGLARLRTRLGDAALGYEALGGYELLRSSHLPALEQLDAVNRNLRPLFGEDVFRLDPSGLRGRGFGPEAQALVANRFEGQLHSGRTMRALALLAAQSGILVHGGVEVRTLDEDDGSVWLQATADGGARSLRFRAGRVALCTNGFLNQLVPECGILPARGQVLVTAPIPDLPWQGTYHMDEGFYYFRNIGQRVLLGGARHLDPATEATTRPALTSVIQDALEDLLNQTLLPGRRVPIEYRWAGIMGFSADKQPRVQAVSPRVALGFGCNGMGVALGAEIAVQTAHLLHG